MVFPTTKNWGVDPGSPVSVAKRMNMERLKREREDPYALDALKDEDGYPAEKMDVDTPCKKIKTEMFVDGISVYFKKEDEDHKVSRSGV